MTALVTSGPKPIAENGVVNSTSPEEDRTKITGPKEPSRVQKRRSQRAPNADLKNQIKNLERRLGLLENLEKRLGILENRVNSLQNSALGLESRSDVTLPYASSPMCHETDEQFPTATGLSRRPSISKSQTPNFIPHSQPLDSPSQLAPIVEPTGVLVYPGVDRSGSYIIDPSQYGDLACQSPTTGISASYVSPEVHAMVSADYTHPNDSGTPLLPIAQAPMVPFFGAHHQGASTCGCGLNLALVYSPMSQMSLNARGPYGQFSWYMGGASGVVV
ncbi:hypothetical protein FDECE_15819 [Fusarium decemcellulare]|nr:hypothetical protein FDECE_15819 [Fusarium decemcellulare]